VSHKNRLETDEKHSNREHAGQFAKLPESIWEICVREVKSDSIQQSVQNLVRLS
jgi:hypothetical protein